MDVEQGDGTDPGEEPGLREVPEVQVDPESSSFELAFSA